MALRGSIDDVPIVDVLQFVHLSGKSGTLALTSAAGPAWVEFSQGNIVFARGPKSRSLGELLVEIGGLTRDQVQGAVDQQARDPSHPPLGKILLSRSILGAEGLAECVRRQIHEAMMDIANWRSGDFQFDQGAVEVVDDTKVDVAEVLPLLKLNTQFLLFEAVRLFDERNRDAAETTAREKKEPALTPAPGADPTAPPRDKPLPPTRETTLPPPREFTPGPRSPLPAGVVALSRAEPLWVPGAPGEPQLLGGTALPGPDRHVPEVHSAGPASGILLVGFEKAVSTAVAGLLTRHGYKLLGHVPRKDVEPQFLADRRWPTGMVVLWRMHLDPARPGEFAASVRHLERVVAKHPAWNVVALVSGRDLASVARVYAAGARAAMPVDPRELAVSLAVQDGLLAVVGQMWKDAARAANDQAAELRAWLQAKRVTSEMQRALQKASIALELMRVAATTLDRAVLFLAKEAELIGLGAFGLTASGRPMAESLRGIAVKVVPETPLARCLGERTALLGPSRELGLGQLFFDLAGRPASDRGVLVPLVGPSKAIGVLYGDNGQLQGPLRSIHVIEMAAAQAGIAYENVLLRMRLDGSRKVAEPADG